LIGGFLDKGSGRQEAIAAVDISFGLDVLCEALSRAGKKNEFAEPAALRKAFVIPVGGEREAFSVVQVLRRAGASAAIDLLGRGVGKNAEYAARQGYRYAVFVGKAEASLGKVKLRDLLSGEEKMLPVADAAKAIVGG
jgi:histidyl-tRNA synthetase